MPKTSELSISPSDSSILSTLLSKSSALKKQATFSFEINWLLVGGEDSPLWKTKNGGKEKLINSEWHNTEDVSFDVSLPDNSNLMDLQNRNLLKLVQRWSFLIRNGAFSTIVNPSVWSSYTRFGILIIYWLVDNDAEFKSREHGLQLISQDAIAKLMSDLAEDNWAEALRATKKIMTKLLELSGIETETLGNLYQIDESLIPKITETIRSHGGYRTFYGAVKLELISRSWLAQITSLPLGVLSGSYRVSVFLRQFEPDYEHQSLLLIYKAHRLHPSQNCPLLSECLSQTSAYLTYLTHSARLSLFLTASKRFPELIGDLQALDVNGASRTFEKTTRARTHHNLMPIGIGLYLLDKALEWITNYGEYVAQVAISFTEKSAAYRRSAAWKADNITQRTANLDSALYESCEKASFEKPQAHEELAISSRNTRHGQREDSSSLKNAVHVLAGACAYLISSLNPSRYKEIQGLKRNCIITSSIFEKREVNYWMWHDFGKSGMLGRNQEGATPIPEIVVTAVELMQRLGDAFAKCFHDNSDDAKQLFYLPVGLDWEQPKSIKNIGNINIFMDKFCDAVKSPLDNHGRRWYAQIHELRKLFIITLFWHEKYHSLDAARYAAGHIDLKHTINYVETDISGDEISQIEAEYIDNRLIELETKKIDSYGNLGLCALYKDVCNKFGVSNIESVPEKIYFDYLIQLQSAGKYSIKPVLVDQYDRQGISKYEIAVAYGEVHDEIYD